MSRRAVAQSLTLMAAWLRPSRPINTAPRPRGARQLVFLRDCSCCALNARVLFYRLCSQRVAHAIARLSFGATFPPSSYLSSGYSLAWNMGAITSVMACMRTSRSHKDRMLRQKGHLRSATAVAAEISAPLWTNLSQKLRSSVVCRHQGDACKSDLRSSGRNSSLLQ